MEEAEGCAGSTNLRTAFQVPARSRKVGQELRCQRGSRDSVVVRIDVKYPRCSRFSLNGLPQVNVAFATGVDHRKVL